MLSQHRMIMKPLWRTYTLLVICICLLCYNLLNNYATEVKKNIQRPTKTLGF